METTRLTPAEREYIERSPLPARLLAKDLKISVAQVNAIRNES